MLKGITLKPYAQSDSVDKFYKDLSNLETEYNTKKSRKEVKNLDGFDKASQLRKLRKTSEALSDIRKEINDTYDDPYLPPGDKRSKIDGLNKDLMNKAREALGRNPIK